MTAEHFYWYFSAFLWLLIIHNVWMGIRHHRARRFYESELRKLELLTTVASKVYLRGGEPTIHELEQLDAMKAELDERMKK